MIWKRRYKRAIKRFALFPIRIGGEFRWLETVYIIQHRLWDHYFDRPLYLFRRWKNDRFVDKACYYRVKCENMELLVENLSKIKENLYEKEKNKV